MCGAEHFTIVKSIDRDSAQPIVHSSSLPTSRPAHIKVIPEREGRGFQISVGMLTLS
jgi:hypothetical protein